MEFNGVTKRSLFLFVKKETPTILMELRKGGSDKLYCFKVQTLHFYYAQMR